jgi:hypothetical protein
MIITGFCRRNSGKGLERLPSYFLLPDIIKGDAFGYIKYYQNL